MKMTISLCMSLIIFLLCVYLVTIKQYREIISLYIIFLSTGKVFIADDIYSSLLYSAIAIMYGILLYNLEFEDRI